MGDRTNVSLLVLTSQANTTKSFFEYTCDEEKVYDEQTSFYFSEVNYGELPFLSELISAGIAYDSDWDRGDEYGSGIESARFTAEGELVKKTIYEDAINPPIDSLLSRIDNPIELRQFIVDYVEKSNVLPWDNQEEYGKIYRVKQLINSG